MLRHFDTIEIFDYLLRTVCVSLSLSLSLSLSNISHDTTKSKLLKFRQVSLFLYVKLLVINCTLKSCCEGKYKDCFGIGKNFVELTS